MTSPPPFLALDIGAASGRAMLSVPGSSSLEVREVHRFVNRPVPLGGALYWDFLYIWDNVLEAMRKCAGDGVRELAGIGVDTWNIDFGLVDAGGSLIRNPLSYRSPTCPEALEEIRGRVGEQELYRITGHGYSPITGVARLLQLRRELGKDILRGAVLLPLPDLVRHYLCGSTDAEETVLWGTQLADVRTRGVSSRLLEGFDLPPAVFPPVTRGGRDSGALLSEICRITGIEHARVFTVAEHDTMSAVLAGAALGEASGRQPSAVLCTGSWFILGRLLPEPRTDAGCLARGVANEIAALGSTFFARNLMGFFLLEELMREWRLSDPGLSWDELFREAAAAPAFSLSVDPDDPQFFSPANAARSLAEYLERTGQALCPQSRGAVARAILEGLVISCRRALAEIEELTGEPVQRIAVVGGGARNPLLCRMLADGLERPVAVGPAEATVMGNIALQMMGSGELSGPGEVFHLLARSCPREVHEPSCSGPWQERAKRREA